MSTHPGHRPPPPPDPPLDDGYDLVEDRAFLERLERLTWMVARALIVGVPVMVLVLFGFLSVYDRVGPLLPLFVAVLVAAGAVVSVELITGRRRARPVTAEPGDVPRPPRTPYRRLVWVGVALFVVLWIVFVYAVAGSA